MLLCEISCGEIMREPRTAALSFTANDRAAMNGLSQKSGVYSVGGVATDFRLGFGFDIGTCFGFQKAGSPEAYILST